MWKFLFCFLFIRYGTGEKIIIIGAGSSGIAAASKLLSHNISDFRILEAEDRIGGRIHSIHLGSAYVDLGAQYVHGMKNNLAYELAHNFVIPGNELNYTWMYYNGKRRVDDNLLNTLWDLTPETYEDGGSNVSVGDAFLSRYNSTVFNQYKNDTQMLTFAKDFIRICECSILGLEGSFSWFKPIATSSFQDCDGPNTLSWNGLGYKTILDLLLKNFPNKTGYDITNNLSLNTTVTKIIMEENSVKVKCADDSEYNTEYVLWTPSLGVLKHDHKSIFQPKLSDERINAIENFGFDGVMKIVFEFPNNWWGEEKYFWFVWNEKDKDDVIKDVSFGSVKNGDHWLSWFFHVGSAPNNSNVLIGWMVGPMVAETEKLTEEQMKNGTVYVMRKFLSNDFNVSEPIRVIHSKWCTDPKFRGTYSFETMDMSIKNISSPQRILQQPVFSTDGVPRIFFGGEATSPTRYGTVDGAIETGYREGNRLASILKNQD